MKIKEKISVEDTNKTENVNIYENMAGINFKDLSKTSNKEAQKSDDISL